MITLHINLTEPQVERLKARSRATGLNVSELVRRLVDAGASQWEDDAARERIEEARRP